MKLHQGHFHGAVVRTMFGTKERVWSYRGPSLEKNKEDLIVDSRLLGGGLPLYFHDKVSARALILKGHRRVYFNTTISFHSFVINPKWRWWIRKWYWELRLKIKAIHLFALFILLLGCTSGTEVVKTCSYNCRDLEAHEKGGCNPGEESLAGCMNSCQEIQFRSGICSPTFR